MNALRLPASLNRNPHRFHTQCSDSGLNFLVDTGAAVSCLPPAADDVPDPSLSLRAANGTPIPTYGTRAIEVKLGGRRYTWNFRVAQVSRPIIGADFLAHHDLVVHVRAKRIFPAAKTLCDEIAAVKPVAPEQFAVLLRSRPQLTKPNFDLPVAKHGILHHILKIYQLVSCLQTNRRIVS